MDFIIENKTLTHFEFGPDHDSSQTVLTIPQGVEKIAHGADNEIILRQYKTLVLPDSLKTIENGALYQLRRLENIVLGKNSNFLYAGGCLYSADGKNLITSVNKIETVDIIDGCENVYDCAFLFRPDIKTIRMPDTVTTIGKRCFLYCSALGKMTLSEKLREIPFAAFVNCSRLHELYIPKSVASIEDNAVPATTKLVFHAGSPAESYAQNHSMPFTKLLD